MKFLLICLLMCVIKENVKAQCSWTSSEDIRCDCHCTLQSDCNVYGGCRRSENTCSKGWSGMLCQRENIALNRPSNQSSTDGIYYSERSVDGNVMTSARTTYSGNQYLTVFLSPTVLVQWIQLRVLQDNTYDVYVTDAVTKKMSYCGSKAVKRHEDTEIECTEPIKGNAVRVSLRNYGQILLNEVTVFSCSDGMYGKQCTSLCSFGCADICNDITGACECKANYYGARCDLKCSTGCQLGICNSSDGACTPCKFGFEGIQCNNCTEGHYGDNCTSCSVVGYCIENSCNADTGYCNYGCEDGWFGSFCNNPCTETCQTCDRKTGECTKCKAMYTGVGCLDCIGGYYGSFCNIPCSPDCSPTLGCNRTIGLCNACREGRYGNFCDLKCSSNCINQAKCDMHGVCTGGCKSGWRGATCDSECTIDNCLKCAAKDDVMCEICKDGFFRTKNMCKKCPTGCTTCLNELQCTSCAIGLKGQICSENCNANCTNKTCLPNGYCKYECTNQGHGLECSQPCRDNCLKCYSGNNCTECIDRYFGQYCTGVCSPNCQKCKNKRSCELCDQGYYGPSCSERCPDKCLTCSEVNGTCTSCISGYYGSRCDINCSQNCIQSECSIYSGSCLQGCLDGFSGDMCAKVVMLGSDSSNALIVSLSVAISVLLILCLGFILICKRRLNRAANAAKKMVDTQIHYQNETDNEMDNHYANAEESNMSDDVRCQNASPYALRGSTVLLTEINHDDLDSEELVDELQISEYKNVSFNKIKVDELWKIVNQKKAEDKFRSEFEEIPNGLMEPYNEAVTRKNRRRNRYKNIYPYNYNRVTLQPVDDTETTDYINASFIDGYERERAYIAAQGPFTPETLLDFWQMIWQAGASTVVMLTNLIEVNIIKCQQYWPDDCAEYGNITVQKLKEEQFDNFTVRTFNVHMDACRRSLVHFQYTSWPDRGVPQNAASIIDFRKKVASISCDNDGPIVVHCSAGVGRTGTYLALDYLIKEGEQEGSVDVVNGVFKLRQQRTNVVQTLEQYIYLHEALVDGLSADGVDIKAEDFKSFYNGLKSKNQTTNKSHLQEQYELLNRLSPAFSSSHFKTARQPGNREKNRYPKILAADSCRVFLAERPGSSNYINAIFLPGYKRRDAFILTQMPTDRTVEDFWHMVFQQDVSTIVMMNSVRKHMGGGVYWPLDGKSLETGIFNIEHVDIQSPSAAFDVKTLKVSTKTDEYQERIIKQFQCKCWPEDALTPQESHSILEFLESVNAWKNQADNPLTVVHCMNGAKKSGLFCVLSVIIERLSAAQEVGIFQSVLQMRSRRLQIVSNKDQLEFCYETVQTYLDEFHTYSNIS